jgi:hypothetical protein
VTTLLIVAASLAYSVIGLWVARHLYGRMRAHQVDKRFNETDYLYRDGDRRLAEAVEFFNSIDRGPFMLLAFLAGLAFPVALPVGLGGWGVRRWLLRTPVRSQAELGLERDRMKARIAELEHDLGIREAS